MAEAAGAASPSRRQRWPAPVGGGGQGGTRAHAATRSTLQLTRASHALLRPTRPAAAALLGAPRHDGDADAAMRAQEQAPPRPRRETSCSPAPASSCAQRALPPPPCSAHPATTVTPMPRCARRSRRPPRPRRENSCSPAPAFSTAAMSTAPSAPRTRPCPPPTRGAILDAAASAAGGGGARHLHIVDLDAAHGVQWPPLLAIADRTDPGVGPDHDVLLRTGDGLLLGGVRRAGADGVRGRGGAGRLRHAGPGRRPRLLPRALLQLLRGPLRRASAPWRLPAVPARVVGEEWHQVEAPSWEAAARRGAGGRRRRASGDHRARCQAAQEEERRGAEAAVDVNIR
ncbi:hypothetical protein U9M48_015666 [Paspalum notatum var. saurae]|uniref:Uncharacterized protein n=1 Tax=Paspalum notatum var. saurae TaxID=547442 RepID=A0AAQ3T5R8_PASNO